MSKAWNHILDNFYRFTAGICICFMIICCENDPEIINETNPVDETDPIALDLDLVRYLAIGDSYTVGEGIRNNTELAIPIKKKITRRRS